jgi:hypothetical protein
MEKKDNDKKTHCVLFEFVTEVRNIVYLSRAVQWRRLLVAGVSPWRPGFDPSLIHVGILVHKVAQGQIFLRVLQFSPASIILSTFGTSSKPL